MFSIELVFDFTGFAFVVVSFFISLYTIGNDRPGRFLTGKWKNFKIGYKPLIY